MTDSANARSCTNAVNVSDNACLSMAMACKPKQHAIKRVKILLFILYFILVAKNPCKVSKKNTYTQVSVGEKLILCGLGMFFVLELLKRYKIFAHVKYFYYLCALFWIKMPKRFDYERDNVTN